MPAQARPSTRLLAAGRCLSSGRALCTSARTSLSAVLTLPLPVACAGAAVPPLPQHVSSSSAPARAAARTSTRTAVRTPRLVHAHAHASARRLLRTSATLVSFPPSSSPLSLSSSSSSSPQAVTSSASSRPFSTCSSDSSPPSSSSTSTSSPSHATALLHVSPRSALAARQSLRLQRNLLRLAPAMGQTRDHGGHGHHHHHHDNAYLTSANKNDPGVRITRIGLLSNLAMAIAKFIGGWAFNSKAMVADAWHSIADLASDILTLATVSWSIKPPSDRFPLGFGKVESLGSLGVSGMLLIGGVYMGWESAISLYGHFNPEAAHHILEHVGHGHSHSHSAADLDIPSVHAAWLAAGTILIKEWLYHATMKVARERKSSVLASNAIHHRVDSLTGIVTLVAIIGANTIQNAAWLDPVGGLLISLMVINAGYSNTQSALYELIDQTIDSEVKGNVRKQAMQALGNVSEGHEAEVRDVSGVKSGQNYLIDLEMAVPGAWTVDDLREVENAVRTQVGAKVRGARRIRIRFSSKEAPVNEKFDEFVFTNLDVDPEAGHDHEHEHGQNGHAVNGQAHDDKNEHNHKH